MYLESFTIPQGPDALLRIHYHPEPFPVVRADAMNPWADARQQSLRLAEETAWKEIQRLTGNIRSAEARIRAHLRDYNWALNELEGHIDQELAPDMNLSLPLPGVSPITSKADLVMKLVFPPFFLPGLDMVGKIISGAFGIGKKAKPVQAYIDQLVGKMRKAELAVHREQTVIQADVATLQSVAQSALTVKSQIDERDREAHNQATGAYLANRATMKQTAEAHAQRVRIDMLLHPSRPGVNHAL